jgi:hypothetical protein
VGQGGGWVQVIRKVRKLCGKKSVVIDRRGHGLEQLIAEGERSVARKSLLCVLDRLWLTEYPDLASFGAVLLGMEEADLLATTTERHVGFRCPVFPLGSDEGIPWTFLDGETSTMPPI